MDRAEEKAVELGVISKNIEVRDIILRQVSKSEWDEEGEAEKEFRLQARIVNVTKDKLCDVIYDLSYYDVDGRFLGLDKSGILDEDEMDANDHLPIDISTDFPANSDQFIFSVRAKKAGCVSRWFWG